LKGKEDMQTFPARRAFRVIREVQITHVEFADTLPTGEISTTSHKEPLHGWDLHHRGQVISIEEVPLPDETTLAQAPHVQVEYVLPHMSREDEGIQTYIPLPLVSLLGSLEAAFELCTDEDRSAIVFYDERFNQLYTADGSVWEDREAIWESSQSEFKPCCICGKPAEGEDTCVCSCPQCGESCYNDGTVIDHGKCYDCHQKWQISTGEENDV
jgi:hypothetical protein